MPDKVERKWVWLYALFVMVITTVPYALGFILQGEEWRFTGFIFGVEDGNSYIAKMLTGAQGAWLFRTPYTAFPQRGVLAFLPYLLLGKLSLASARHESLVWWFHIFRLAGGFMMVHATYQFVSVFIDRIPSRRLVTAIATVGGGLGWLAVTGLDGLWQNRLPLEFYSPETFGFMSLYGLPHLSCARALLLWGLAKYLRSGERSWLDGFFTGSLWLLLGLMQPMTVLIGGAVIGVHLLLTGVMATSRGADLQSQWKTDFHYALGMAILPAPLILYTAVSFLTDPFLSTWSAQNILPSPPLLDYLLAYGSMLILAGFGIQSIHKWTKDNRWFLLLGWVAIFPLLAYAPFSVQRRLTEGVWVAITILGIAVLDTFKPRMQRVIRIFLLSSFLPGLIFIAGGLGTVMQLKSPVYRPAKEVAAFEHLGIAADPGNIVIASYATSNPLPSWAPLRILIGHGPESIHLKDMKLRVENFYQADADDAVRRALLEEFAVRYVFWGPQERELGEWQPSQANFLQEWYEKDGYHIYRVVD